MLFFHPPSMPISRVSGAAIKNMIFRANIQPHIWLEMDFLFKIREIKTVSG
jgi:hypothetical protein